MTGLSGVLVTKIMTSFLEYLAHLMPEVLSGIALASVPTPLEYTAKRVIREQIGSLSEGYTAPLKL